MNPYIITDINSFNNSFSYLKSFSKNKSKCFSENELNNYTKIPNFNSNELTSMVKQELKILEECTFRPKTLNSKLPMPRNPNENVFEKLYNYNSIRQERKLNKAIQILQNETRECTFTPQIKVLKKSKSSDTLNLNFNKKLENVKKNIFILI